MISDEDRKTLAQMNSWTQELLKRIHTEPALHSALRTREFQTTWGQLYLLAVFGLNLASGGNLNESGEVVVLDLLRSSFSKEKKLVVFDVGANVGDYTAAVLERLGDNVEVYCFEPLPGNYKVLKERYAKDKRVSVLESAVGNETGSMDFFVNSEESTLGALGHRKIEHWGVEMKNQGAVKVVRLDEYAEQNGIESIDLLKIDVEGYEYGVLEGAGNLLRDGRIQLVQWEFGAANLDTKTSFKDFFRLLNPNFRIFRILTDGLQEISAYGDINEIFWCGNYVGISRLA